MHIVQLHDADAMRIHGQGANAWHQVEAQFSAKDQEWGDNLLSFMADKWIECGNREELK